MLSTAWVSVIPAPGWPFFGGKLFRFAHHQCWQAAALLRAKAVLCPGLRVSLAVEADPSKNESWHYADGLQEYLEQALDGAECIPLTTVMHGASGTGEAVDYALKWIVDGPAVLAESYVNLIPTPQGGTHVNGLRSGLIDALKEFCEFRDLIPRGVKLTGDDIWDSAVMS